MKCYVFYNKIELFSFINKKLDMILFTEEDMKNRGSNDKTIYYTVFSDRVTYSAQHNLNHEDFEWCYLRDTCHKKQCMDNCAFFDTNYTKVYSRGTKLKRILNK